ncbi:hypothetical protein NX059_000429 [Plenodomus lindquistii]|nr:hypothetical protein NX059_000429 [Plenodomus lindquistii]
MVPNASNVDETIEKGQTTNSTDVSVDQGAPNDRKQYLESRPSSMRYKTRAGMLEPTHSQRKSQYGAAHRDIDASSSATLQPLSGKLYRFFNTKVQPLLA